MVLLPTASKYFFFFIKKWYLSFKLHKLNKIKTKFIDSPHVFYKVIVKLPMMDINNGRNIQVEIK